MPPPTQERDDAQEERHLLSFRRLRMQGQVVRAAPLGHVRQRMNQGTAVFFACALRVSTALDDDLHGV